MNETEPIPTYVDTIAAWLATAEGITPADQPYVVHLRMLAQSLDRQFADDGKIQSALASTFVKLLGVLDKRNLGPAPDPLAGQIPGQTDLLQAQF